MAKRGKSTGASTSQQPQAERMLEEAVRELLSRLRPRCREFSLTLERAVRGRKSGTYRLAVRMTDGIPESAQIQTDHTEMLDRPQPPG